MRFDLRFPSFLLFGAVSAFSVNVALAQEYPTKPIRYIVGNSPGSPVDTVARLTASGMAKLLGQPVVVENKLGAGSVIAYEYVAKQVPADGYTVASVLVTELATLPLTMKDLRFDPLKDLPPVIGLAEQRQVFGSASSMPWKSLGELVAAAKANPGKFNIGGLGSLLRLLSDGFVGDLGINVTYVPYLAAAPLVQDHVSGRLQMGFLGASTAISLGNKFRVLAVTGVQRRPPFLDVPTFGELGHPRIPSVSFSMNAPVGTPKAALERLHAAASQSLQQPEVAERFAKFPLEIVNEAPDAAARRLADAAGFFADYAKRAGLQPQTK